MIRAPTGINKYYGNMPILEYDKPFVPIEADMLLPDIFPVPSPTTNMAILNGVEMYVRTCNPYNSCCSGKHCNKSDMYRNGQVQKFCACHQMCSRSGEPGIAWGLNLTTRGGDRISTYDFSSTTFLFDWIFKRRFSCIIRAGHLDDYDTLPLIEEAGTKVIDEVNRSGGWTCIMWQKWGHVADSAAPTKFVQAGMVTHHLVSIAPTRPELLNSTKLNGFKVDLKDL